MFKNLIGGEWVESTRARRNINPSDTRDVIGEYAQADAEQTRQAIAAAAKAQAAWGLATPQQRFDVLDAAGTEILARKQELGDLLAREEGKTLPEAIGEAARAGSIFKFFAGEALRVRGDAIASVRPGVGVEVTREPIGVVGLITPWNFPLNIANWKIAPALAAGNTVVLKPASLTPLSVLRYAELAIEAGIPEGALNVVPGPGGTVGAALVEHPAVGKIGFTGSTEVGAGIARQAAATIKRVTLELGGKSANVVFGDADLEAAAASAPLAVFGNAGQDCCARSRILVEESALDRFMELLGEAVEALEVGDPLDERTQMGPLISEDQRVGVASYLNDGAPVAIRGSAPEGPGFWFAPTVLCPVSNEDRAAREEIFGPVACVIPFRDEDDAVRIANDTIYGLSGSIWTRDGAKALRVARAIDTGVVSINANTSVRVTSPFGGFKQSGVGRELGPHALDHYTEVKNVFYATEG
jgi:acyl-CoA reductase-like NAD-dependent aldehyde dehydrogenase